MSKPPLLPLKSPINQFSTVFRFSIQYGLKIQAIYICTLYDVRFIDNKGHFGEKKKHH